jgi:hypothetical protein
MAQEQPVLWVTAEFLVRKWLKIEAEQKSPEFWAEIAIQRR